MKALLSLALVIGLVGLTGCRYEESAVENLPAIDGKQFLVEMEPADAMPVGDVRQSAQDGDSVTLVGHIGGSPEPFVEGIAAFTIVDQKIPYCQPEEGCPKPWDYCCTQNQVKNNIATIKVVDEGGAAVTAGAKELLGVKELSLVVVEGKAIRDDLGNLSVQTSKVFIKEL